MLPCNLCILMELLHFFGHEQIIFAGYQRSYLICTIENQKISPWLLPCLFKINNKDNEEN